jgi:hypothetical protein
MSLFQLQPPEGEIRLSPGPAPRRRGDREMTPGRCGNLDYCSIGMQRVLVQVPVSQPFICPECGGRLRPPGSRWRGSKPALLPLLRLMVLALCCAASMGLGYSIGRVQPAVQAASHKAAAELTALIAPPPPVPVAAILPPTPPPPPAPKPAPPILVSNRPFPPRLASADITDPPARLPHEAKFGQVVIDCGLDSLSTKASCKIGDVRGGDAFSKSAQAWLESLAVQYAPGDRAGTPILLDHRWRVTFQDYDGLPKIAPKIAK